ncbi:MAG: endo-beta-N-acetylglucosaminidase [Oscillospiraceae bacterium]
MTSFLTISLSSGSMLTWWAPADGPPQNIAIGSSEKEYGIIAIPMAAATNAAHKNGVITLAEYFIPREPQYTEEWLYQDENGEFPYAKKLVELAKYYGFDGYFIKPRGLH